MGLVSLGRRPERVRPGKRDTDTDRHRQTQTDTDTERDNNRDRAWETWSPNYLSGRRGAEHARS